MGTDCQVAAWENRQRDQEPLELDDKEEAQNDGKRGGSLRRRAAANCKEVVHNTPETAVKLMATTVLNR